LTYTLCAYLAACYGWGAWTAARLSGAGMRKPG
jgi:hypothetical protein